MIRIEGIPIVAARLADTQNTKTTQIRDKRRRTQKIAAGVKASFAGPIKRKVA